MAARRKATTQISRLARRAGGTTAANRMVPEETPVAFSFAGTTHAVMMASPADFEDFALGFSLTEGIIADPKEIEAIEVEDLGAGIDIQIRLKDKANTRFQARRRRLAGPVGCGLCGIESLEEAVRPTPEVANGPNLDRAAIAAGMRQLAQAQSLNTLTGGAHAAAFVPKNHSAIVREDVGRHNALDKLVGALARTSGAPPVASGFLAITSRASWEMVHKAAHAGIAVIAAISAPTSLAIEAADAAGITLIAFARDESMNIYTHAARIA